MSALEVPSTETTEVEAELVKVDVTKIEPIRVTDRFIWNE